MKFEDEKVEVSAMYMRWVVAGKVKDDESKMRIQKRTADERIVIATVLSCG